LLYEIFSYGSRKNIVNCFAVILSDLVHTGDFFAQLVTKCEFFWTQCIVWFYWAINFSLIIRLKYIKFQTTFLYLKSITLLT